MYVYVVCNFIFFFILVTLGNAYFTQFFSGGQNGQLMKQCIAAYTQAVCK